MRRKARDRKTHWPDIPSSACPGEFYFWDGDNQKWVYIEDDMDMSWITDSLCGKDADPDKKVSSVDDMNSGKTFKKVSNPTLKGWACEGNRASLH